MATYEELRQQVQESGGVLTVEAWVLREAQGAGRLTRGINEAICDSLAANGMGAIPHTPDLMPTNQEGLVRLYTKDSPVGKVLEAANIPGEDNDHFILESVDERASELVQKIRMLLA
ncbi:hypothetical protein GCM10022261_05710 [Brevibacterium daeguense]|uniref:Uncharacterized protein n=1 Tax=Brevibacterium daeguense TaxID=909936 RepID=A0ABP8EGI9_9MICO|nr:hypothetical protein [Brevibacterium daeguense]